MAYDEDLAERLRHAVEGEPGLSEKRMFGGLAFLVHGNMAVAASGEGGLLVRIDPADADRLTTPAHVERMVMRGRAMAGWLRVGDDAIRTDEELESWVGIGLVFARALPAK
jgi:TfoX/Sxy family transcriptional regulator of competence genes